MQSTSAATLSRLRAVSELAEQVGSAGDLGTLADRTVELAARLVGDAALLWLPTPDNHRLECMAVSHPKPAGQELLATIRAGIGALAGGPVAGVVSSGEPLLAAGLEVPVLLADAHPAFRPWLNRFGVGALAVLPLRSRGRVVGALAMARDDGHEPYAEEDVLFLQALADVTAVGIDLDQVITGSATTWDELRRQSELIDHVSDAVIMLDGEQRVLSWNAAAERIYGYGLGEVLGGDLFALLGTEYTSAEGEPVDREQVIAETRRAGHWTGELRERHADGRTVQTLSSFSALPDSTAGTGAIVVVSRDVTEQRHKEHLATHDELTSLPNRRLLEVRLQGAIDHAALSRTALALVFLDLNGFKAVNDRLGHDAGDEVLRVTAHRLREIVRGADVVGRLGGDEFVVIATDVTAEGARLLGDRLLAGLSAPIRVGGEDLVVPPSIGIAVSLGVETPDELMRNADAAMYEAKQQRTGVAHASAGEVPVDAMTF